MCTGEWSPLHRECMGIRRKVETLVFRIGIVGFETHLHSNRFLNDPRASLVAAAEEVLEAPKWRNEGQRFVEQHRREFVPSYERLLERPDIDAVSINTQTFLKPGLVELAAENGKHVICDKPMARNVADARRMAKVVKRSGVVFLVQYPNRYDPLQEKVIELSVPGRVGCPLVAYVEFVRYADIYDEQGALIDPHYMGWVTDSHRSGGGELINFGCYAVSFLKALARSRAESVFAQTHSSFFRLHKERGVEDLGDVTVLFENGFISHLVAGRVPALADSYMLRVFCQEGSLASPGRGKLFKAARSGEVPIDIPEVDATQRMISHFLDCIEGKSEPLTSVEDGLEDTVILEAAYRSARHRRSIALV